MSKVRSWNLSERITIFLEQYPDVADAIEDVFAEKDARIKQLEDRNKLLSRDNINLRKFIVDSRNKLSDFITRT